jgi:hypothetical protein
MTIEELEAHIAATQAIINAAKAPKKSKARKRERNDEEQVREATEGAPPPPSNPFAQKIKTQKAKTVADALADLLTAAVKAVEAMQADPSSRDEIPMALLKLHGKGHSFLLAQASRFAPFRTLRFSAP